MWSLKRWWSGLVRFLWSRSSTSMVSSRNLKLKSRALLPSSNSSSRRSTLYRDLALDCLSKSRTLRDSNSRKTSSRNTQLLQLLRLLPLSLKNKRSNKRHRCRLKPDSTTESSTCAHLQSKLFSDCNPVSASYSENTCTARISLRSTHPSSSQVLPKVAQTSSPWNTSNRMLA